jgi:hypothetical protein
MPGAYQAFHPSEVGKLVNEVRPVVVSLCDAAMVYG